ncbi:MAG: PEP-CTERM sorting domain-containing protein [Kiritimatiellales bacterium]
MKTILGKQSSAMVIGLLVGVLCMSVRADVVLLSDDLSTLNSFSNSTITAGVSFETDGANAVFTGGDGAGDRAKLVSVNAFDFNPGGSAYESVTLEFTTSCSSATADRFEVGLIYASGVKYYDNSLSKESNVRGAVVSLTGTDYPAGLVFNYASGTAPGGTAVGASAVTGEHTYKIVFTSTGTELFLDGISQGTTADVLDFSMDYNVVAFGQGYDTRPKTLNDVTLSAVIPEPATTGMMILGAVGMIWLRRLHAGQFKA